LRLLLGLVRAGAERLVGGLVVRLALLFRREEAGEVMVGGPEIQRLLGGPGIFVEVVRAHQIGPESADEVVTGRCDVGHGC
jgi:hypothetical protein